jgi:hypothetical protein
LTGSFFSFFSYTFLAGYYFLVAAFGADPEPDPTLALPALIN